MLPRAGRALVVVGDDDHLPLMDVEVLWGHRAVPLLYHHKLTAIAGLAL
jgi:hypothetical protein